MAHHYVDITPVNAALKTQIKKQFGKAGIMSVQDFLINTTKAVNFICSSKKYQFKGLVYDTGSDDGVLLHFEDSDSHWMYRTENGPPNFKTAIDMEKQWQDRGDLHATCVFFFPAEGNNVSSPHLLYFFGKQGGLDIKPEDAIIYGMYPNTSEKASENNSIAITPTDIKEVDKEVKIESKSEVPINPEFPSQKLDKGLTLDDIRKARKVSAVAKKE